MELGLEKNEPLRNGVNGLRLRIDNKMINRSVAECMEWMMRLFLKRNKNSIPKTVLDGPKNFLDALVEVVTEYVETIHNLPEARTRGPVPYAVEVEETLKEYGNHRSLNEKIASTSGWTGPSLLGHKRPRNVEQQDQSKRQRSGQEPVE
ncbi:unnamed protein product [Bursaphelenchus xylophilus]|nr:unnamed protein product [Bursaphelenchus xylophilus]CAG9107956.1 unnamed protein product [Bursaphelenchus xylophilus]